jgi:membrane fusion protein, adhesin transport system
MKLYRKILSAFEPRIDDSGFMPELEAATRLRPSTAATFMLLAIMALVSIAILWAAVSQVEIITRAEGAVVPSRDVQIVQSLEGGILQELAVQQGEKVEKGQVLLRLSDVEFSSEARGTEAKYLGLQARKARLNAEANGTPLSMPAEIAEKAPQVAATEEALYNSRQNELRAAIAILDDRITRAGAQIAETSADMERFTSSAASLRKELVITQEMVAKRAMPKLEQMRLEREITDMDGQMNAAIQRKKALEAERQVAQRERDSQMDKFRSQALGELNDAETQLAGLGESLKSIGDRVDRREVRAPVAGIVNNIAVRTIGGVVEPAMKLVEIVPVDDALKIIARVQPSDIGFVQAGQKARVKITAYDPQLYGYLYGELARVGATSIADRDGKVFFEIEIRTDKNTLGDEAHPLPVTPGMLAQADVIVGRRTVLNYLLKPFVRVRERALTER